MKHKHAAEIIAWANGATIEGRFPGEEWKLAVPYWYLEFEYRVKPEPKPDVVRYFNVYGDHSMGCAHVSVVVAAASATNNIARIGCVRLTIDGETGKISAEVVE